MTVSVDAFSAGAVNGGWSSGVLNRAGVLDANGSFNPTTVNQGFGFITIGASATALVVGIMMASEHHALNDPGTITVTLNPTGTPQVMTQLGPVADFGGGPLQGPTYLFGLVNPASGLGNIEIAWTDDTYDREEFYVYAMSFTGTATTSVADAFYGFASANDGGTMSQFNGVTTNAAVRSGDMAFSIHINDGFNGPGFDDPALNATGTEMDRAQLVTNNSYAQYFTGSGSAILAQADNFNPSFGSSGFWCAAVVAIGTTPTGTTINLTGAGMTSGAGLLAKAIVKPFIGAGATGAAGSFTRTIVKPFTGAALVSGAGSLALAIAKALSGVGMSSASGSFAMAIAKPLAGTALTSGAGSFTDAITDFLTGVALASGAGSFSFGSSQNVNLVGAGLTSAGGSFTDAIVTPFAGAGLTSAAGILTPISGLVVPLSGAGITSGVGSLASIISSALAGAGLVSAPGSIVPSGATKTAVLTGVSATISAGVLTVTFSGVTLPVPEERIIAIPVELRVVFPIE